MSTIADLHTRFLFAKRALEAKIGKEEEVPGAKVLPAMTYLLTGTIPAKLDADQLLPGGAFYDTCKQLVEDYEAFVRGILADE